MVQVGLAQMLAYGDSKVIPRAGQVPLTLEPVILLCGVFTAALTNDLVGDADRGSRDPRVYQHVFCTCGASSKRYKSYV